MQHAGEKNTSFTKEVYAHLSHKKERISSRDRPIPFFETDTDIFNLIFFTDIWLVADIRLATDTDIPNFVYRYICRYFSKEF